MKWDFLQSSLKLHKAAIRGKHMSKNRWLLACETELSDYSSVKLLPSEEAVEARLLYRQQQGLQPGRDTCEGRVEASKHLLSHVLHRTYIKHTAENSGYVNHLKVMKRIWVYVYTTQELHTSQHVQVGPPLPLSLLLYKILKNEGCVCTWFFFFLNKQCFFV